MLTLNVPGGDAALQHTVETRPKAVAAWLDRLPFASPVATGQQLVTTLYALNRHPLGVDDRLALLALYRPAVARVTTGLEALLAESGVPPFAQQRQIGTLLRELQIEHSIGYKQALLALSRQRFGRPHPKRLAEASGRLLAALRDVQAACCLTHTPYPIGLWQEMHQVHAYAHVSGVADHTVDDAPAASLAYRQALLIALADPPCMSHAELTHTRLFLEQFAALAVLASAPVPGHRGFSVYREGDAPPNPLTASQAHDGLWLDADALCRRLHDTALRLRSGEPPGRIGLPSGMASEPALALCKRLLRQWCNTAQRAFKRHASPGGTVTTVAGVSTIHRVLGQAPRADQPEADEPDSLSIPDAESLLAAPVAVQAPHWEVINDSAAGLALAGAPDAPLNLKVGDPLAMRADTAETWSLGVIRWARMRDARQVELGVERLAPHMQPVWVRPLRGRRKASPEPALFIPGLAALKQHDRLLLPRHLYQPGMDAEVWHAPHRYLLTFGRRIEHTPNFDLIDFTVFAGARP